MPESSWRGGTPRIDLVYDPTCPNVGYARAAIRAALTGIGAPIAWREWDCTDGATPAEFRRLGSPSVLVNGQDVGGDTQAAAQADATSCRIYRDECGCLCGAPSADLILRVLKGANSSRETE